MNSFVLRSHIGKTVIKLDPSLSVTFDLPNENKSSNPMKFAPDPRAMYDVKISGPLGSTTMNLFPFVRLSKSNGELQVSIENTKNKLEKAMWGTSRQLINNAVIGCSQGHKCIITLKGIGYRALMDKDRDGLDRIGIKAGFSHIKYFSIPSGIKAEVFQTSIVLSGIDKQQVKLFAHVIRNAHPPECYKGKGIYVDDEVIKLKERKK